MSGYASSTSVSVERSRAEIERMVSVAGAGQFMAAFDNEKGTAIIGWTMNGRMVRMGIPLPDSTEERFNYRKTTYGYASKIQLPPEATRKLYDQACRSRWRAVLLIIKAKFEAIDSGISTLEREFLADVVMADGTTIGEWAAPQLEEMYASKRMPTLLGTGRR